MIYQNLYNDTYIMIIYCLLIFEVMVVGKAHLENVSLTVQRGSWSISLELGADSCLNSSSRGDVLYKTLPRMANRMPLTKRIWCLKRQHRHLWALFRCRRSVACTRGIFVGKTLDAYFIDTSRVESCLMIQCIGPRDSNSFQQLKLVEWEFTCRILQATKEWGW